MERAPKPTQAGESRTSGNSRLGRSEVSAEKMSGVITWFQASLALLPRG
jgi:hypothetical protein